MSTLSSSSSSHQPRRNVYGVLKSCWCGKSLVVWVSETKEKPYHRFYRCEVALQRKPESHLFKWEDEALLDEIRMVDAKVLDLARNVKELVKNTHDELESLPSEIIKRDAGIIDRVNEITSKLCQEVVDVKRKMRDEISASMGANTQKGKTNNWPMINIAVTAAVLGGIFYFYCMSIY